MPTAKSRHFPSSGFWKKKTPSQHRNGRWTGVKLGSAAFLPCPWAAATHRSRTGVVDQREKHFSHRLFFSTFSSWGKNLPGGWTRRKAKCTKHETALEKKEKSKIPDNGDRASYSCYPKLRGFNQSSVQPCCTIHCTSGSCQPQELKEFTENSLLRCNGRNSIYILNNTFLQWKDWLIPNPKQSLECLQRLCHFPARFKASVWIQSTPVLPKGIL